jgi:hypothetical protein
LYQADLDEEPRSVWLHISFIVSAGFTSGKIVFNFGQYRGVRGHWAASRLKVHGKGLGCLGENESKKSRHERLEGLKICIYQTTGAAIGYV